MNMKFLLSVGSPIRAVEKGEVGVREEEEHLGPILDLRTRRAAPRPTWPRMNKNQTSPTGVREVKS